jgi:hypothetical protein
MREAFGECDCLCIQSERAAEKEIPQAGLKSHSSGNAAMAATARELACFMWGLVTGSITAARLSHGAPPRAAPGAST